MTGQPRHTPPLAHAALTPAYDAILALTTREKRWRARLLRQVDPQPGDRILDVGCGTGSFALVLKQAAPEAHIVGLDPDDEALAVAEAKRAAAGLDVTFVHGFMTDETVKPHRPFNKIVSSLVLHQTPLKEKQRIISVIRHLLPPAGEFHLCDYGEQRGLMRLAFRLTVQALDGVADTQPQADGALPDLLRAGGFRQFEQTGRLVTLTGAIAFFRAVKQGPHRADPAPSDPHRKEAETSRSLE